MSAREHPSSPADVTDVASRLKERVYEHPLIFSVATALLITASAEFLPTPWRLLPVSLVTAGLAGAFWWCWWSSRREARPLPALEAPPRDGSCLQLAREKAERVFAVLAEALPASEVESERARFVTECRQGLDTYTLNAVCGRAVYPAHVFAAEGRLWFAVYRRERRTVLLANRLNRLLAPLFAPPPKPGRRSRPSVLAEPRVERRGPS